MKKKIIVCCEAMLNDIEAKRVIFPLGFKNMFLWCNGTGDVLIKACHHCGKELPFPFEESE